MWGLRSSSFLPAGLLLCCLGLVCLARSTTSSPPLPEDAAHGDTAAVAGAPLEPADDAGACPAISGDAATTSTVDDRLPPGRLLRRASFALRGAPPTDAEYDALAQAGDEPAQFEFVHRFIAATLADPIFYRTMFEQARAWLQIPLIGGSDVAEYGATQQRPLMPCPAGTVHAGAWKYFRYDDGACSGSAPDGAAAEVVTVEPWWAPGTTAELVGYAANTSAIGIDEQRAIDCTASGPVGTCGCGPHAVRCHPNFGTYPGMEYYVSWNEHGQRRLLSEEPARLFAHLAWHDRPATDLILGTYSVGPTELQAAYVMEGIQGGSTILVADDAWWNPALFASVAVDPDHAPGDPWAWREYQVPERNPFFLADRDYRFDPRIEAGPMRGIPAAGMLTSLGFLDAYPRERVRAARALENLACEVLDPPSGQTFNPYRRDPGSEGACQHCHRRIDPSAIHFKRWHKRGTAFEGWGATYFMPGVGTVWHWPAAWRTGDYPYQSDPFAHWRRWYVPDTMLTPVAEVVANQNPEALFIDFLPPDQTLLGQRSDGTVGPLGFAKLIVAAGAFDRCVVRRLHEWILGRDVDPTKEAGYLDRLVAEFVSGGRIIRPFVAHLTDSELFRRGF